MKITAKDIQAALVRKISKTNNIWMLNVMWGGGEADFISVTAAGYCHEFEIKVSLPDWNADLKKDKWDYKEQREKIAYFHYVVPLTLWKKAPQWVLDRPEIGILTVQPIQDKVGTYLAIVEKRAAIRLPDTRKLTLKERLSISMKTWARYATEQKAIAEGRKYIETRQPKDS